MDCLGKVSTLVAASSRRLDPAYDKVKAGFSALVTMMTVRLYTASIVKRNAGLLARFWISDPSDGRLDVISDINELLLDEFRKNGIRFA